jgi:hypothetical protein
MIMQAQAQALQDEVKFLIAKLDESEARAGRLEALLREALQWCPRKPAYGTVRGSMGDLGNRIEEELGNESR